MHTSLDSALGRQRRLNQIGETITSIATPAAAYSLRSLTGGDPEVVNVRRASDNNETKFTVSQINSGALLAHVNTPSTVGTAVNCTGSFPYGSFTANGNTGFSASNAGGSTAGAGFPYVFADDDVIVVRYTVTNFTNDSGLSPVLRGTNATNTLTGVTNSGNAITANGTYTDTLTASGNGTHLLFGDGNTGSYTISDFQIVSHSGNGFVETWYDQSGNGNHVTQTLDAGKQPKIVNAGSLLTQGGKACINFDGSNDFLNKATYTQGALSQPNTAFAVAKLDAYTDSNRKVFDGDVSTARNMLQLNAVGNGQFAHFAGTVAATGEDADANRHLFTCLFNGSASRLRIDTTQKSTANAGANSMNGIVIGANHDTVQNFWDGDIQEIIIFNSNQTSNFDAIEGNINSYYSIF